MGNHGPARGESLLPERPGSWPSRVAGLLLMLGLSALLFAAYEGYRSLTSVVQVNRERAYVQETQLLSEQLLALLVDLENGQRGFIITGQEEFLAPFYVAHRRLQEVHTQWRVHMVRTVGPNVSAETLDGLIEHRVRHADRNVSLRRARGEAALKDVGLYVEGKRLMDLIRMEFQRLAALQAQRLQQADIDQDARQRQAFRLLLGLPVLGCTLGMLAVGLLLHEQRQRRNVDHMLRSMNQTLDAQVRQRTAELSEALSRIQSFAQELDRNMEAERRRLAREVHDQFGQMATAIKMNIVGLRQAASSLDERHLDELSDMADQTIALARHIASSLRPPMLDDFGLAAAVDHFLHGIERQGTLWVHVDIRDDALLTPNQANQLFRIVQEAATNVQRHAQAHELNVSGSCSGSTYALSISDDGNGPGQVRPDASGLRNMRERAALAGGSMQFGPGVLGGSCVSVMLPLQTDARAVASLAAKGAPPRQEVEA